MVETTQQPGADSAELVVPKACPVCDGAVVVRVRPGTSWGYCRHCHWLGRKFVRLGADSLRLMHLPGGLA